MSTITVKKFNLGGEFLVQVEKETEVHKGDATTGPTGEPCKFGEDGTVMTVLEGKYFTDEAEADAYKQYMESKYQ